MLKTSGVPVDVSQPVQTEVVIKVTRCNETSWCDNLSSRLGDTYTKGMSPVEVMNLKTGTDPRVIGVVYRMSAKDRGLMLNFCPFCGADILHLTPADIGQNVSEKKTDVAP